MQVNMLGTALNLHSPFLFSEEFKVREKIEPKMGGKRQMEPKVGKKEHRVKKRKLDLKEEMEKIKLWSRVLAKMTAVQRQLVEVVISNSNMEDLHLKCEQLGGVNNEAALLNSMIQNYIHVMLGVFGG
ncbi:hypothetical protein ERO13_A01G097700v2 [Gossypium hirsutum]|uniref:Uncharacterized protein n=8 Tax=Gossypium TaxID=3633 RepID=A0A1U8KIT5_GOSHI|nr:uncharacterized protein LOC107917546 [Gossypium hirsutum]KAG4214053.1 hypothetical protein ERO13_A01G097700v2 [Gossypium hirsutum]TYH30593.1 hypothetical protein ES288_A01G108100v1 [Gossypium darwinii]TYI42670.1 hypothetical protein ES332_A01G115300v1 [Gossypium tomentosum]